MTLSPQTLANVKTIEILGPWDTKSGGELNVLFSFSNKDLHSFLSYNSKELAVTNADIKGLRMYKVSHLTQFSIGAREWHKIRSEVVTVTKGRVLWKLMDTLGNRAEYTLTPTNFSLFIPPYIMHTYEALEDESEVSVIANTLFVVDDTTTHDTYSESEFPIYQ